MTADLIYQCTCGDTGKGRLLTRWEAFSLKTPPPPPMPATVLIDYSSDLNLYCLSHDDDDDDDTYHRYEFMNNEIKTYSWMGKFNIFIRFDEFLNAQRDENVTTPKGILKYFLQKLIFQFLFSLPLPNSCCSLSLHFWTSNNKE